MKPVSVSTITMTLAVSLLTVSSWAADQVKMPPASGQNLGAVTGGHFGKAQPVIQKRCVSCHSEKVIEQAMAAGKDMQAIQHRMEQKGVKLSANDRTVLGVFWKESPLKKK
ncbi:cytochrome C [Geomonas sp.]|uniref:cytochrome C n=1 Tax=Geomonas sp. TaxID=2651584 RepID=UPI002B49C888|nr:cytochrome C [Geomonas sp.]HJV36545.1 cytochrome C [Geomonas sp.]